MSLMPDLTELVDATRQVKERAVARDGVGTDLQPSLTLFGAQMLLVWFEPGDLPEVVEYVVAAYSPTDVVSVCELYVDPTRLNRSDDLAVAFPTDPNILECVSLVHSRPGSSTGVFLPYRYAGRKIEWLDPPTDATDAPVRHPLAIAVEDGFNSNVSQSDALQQLQSLNVDIQALPGL